MSWDWNTILKFAGILLLLIVVEKIGKWLLHEWSPGDTNVPRIILRVILFGIVFIVLWLWLPKVL